MKIINGVECRTREESLRHIIKRAKLKKIGPKTEAEAAGAYCCYLYESGNNCAVGSLFSPKQLEEIDAKAFNELSIGYLATEVGKRNIEEVTGMTLKELELLQKIHDDTLQNHTPQAARDGVRIYCEKELAKLTQKAK
jgi:hypothetical protein